MKHHRPSVGRPQAVLRPGDISFDDLNPRRDHVAELGKIGLIVKGCDVKAVAGLLREQQIDRDHVVLIGVKCGGVLEENELPAAAALSGNGGSLGVFEKGS